LKNKKRKSWDDLDFAVFCVQHDANSQDAYHENETTAKSISTVGLAIAAPRRNRDVNGFFLNHAIPTMATAMAVNAATGFMVCSASQEDTTNASIAVSETKITAVPMAKFLWLNSLTACLLYCYGLF